jgi:hypothetical protein
MAIRNECARGLKYIVGNGKRTRFWLDTWAGECPLKITFPSIFTICNQQEWSAHRVLNSDQLNLTFRRNFGDIENQEYIELREMMSEIQLTNSQDSVRWILERSGNFTTSSLYNELTFTGFSDRCMLCLWKTKVPLKIKIFLWQVIHDKIQSTEQLKKREWSGPIECKLCGLHESTTRIFFECVMAKFCWCAVREVMDWPRSPICSEDVFCLCRGVSNRLSKRVLLLFSSVAWSLWLICNEFVFQDIVVPSPNVGIFRSISFLQKWRILNKEMDRQWIDEVIQKPNLQLSSLRHEG